MEFLDALSDATIMQGGSSYKEAESERLRRQRRDDALQPLAGDPYLTEEGATGNAEEQPTKSHKAAPFSDELLAEAQTFLKLNVRICLTTMIFRNRHTNDHLIFRHEIG